MRLIAAIALACLAGCAHTPQELRTEVEPERFSSTRSPFDASLCLTRNAEEYRPFVDAVFLAQQRPGRSPGSFEVILSNQGIVRAVADVIPTPSGSAISIWLTPYLVWRELPKRMAEGC